MRAGVIMANVIWNVMNTVSGMVPERLSRVTPDRKAILRPPAKEAKFITPASIPVVSKAML